MSSYLPITGILTQIQPITANNATYGCTLMMAVQAFNQGTVYFLVTGDTYVLDNTLLKIGEQATFFYDANAPVPLIYPPQYRAVAAAKSNHSQYYLGQFSNDYISTDQQFQINSNSPTSFYLPNGQPFSGSIAGKTVLVEYTAATKSIPAQISPSRAIVFCFT